MIYKSIKQYQTLLSHPLMLFCKIMSQSFNYYQYKLSSQKRILKIFMKKHLYKIFKNQKIERTKTAEHQLNFKNYLQLITNSGLKFYDYNKYYTMSQGLYPQNHNSAMENEDSYNPSEINYQHCGYSRDHHSNSQINQLSCQRQKINGQQVHQGLKHGWTREDEILLYRLHDRIGNKWAIIAHQMKQRTDNCVKNHFYSKLRKALRKLNKAIHDHYKKQYKEIKMSAFYKIIQAAQQGHKAHSNVIGSVSSQCKDLKNRLLHFADEFDQKSLQTLEGCQIAHKMIKQVVDFNRQYKRKSKKSRKCSGADGAIYPHYFRNQNLAWEDHMSSEQQNDVFYSDSSKNSKKKRKPRYQENQMIHQLQVKQSEKNQTQNKIKFQDEMRIGKIVQTEEIASPLLLRGNSKFVQVSAHQYQQQQENNLYFEESLSICNKNGDFTLFEHLMKPDASENL